MFDSDLSVVSRARDLAREASALALALQAEDVEDVAGVLRDLLSASDGLAAAQAAAVEQADRTETTVESAGLPVEHWLRLWGGRTKREARDLVMAAEVSRDMPGVFGMLAHGQVSADAVKQTVAAVARSSRSERDWIDTELCSDPDLQRSVEGDGLWQTVAQLLAEAHPAEPDERAERARARRYAAVWGRLDGTGRIEAEGPLPEIAEMDAALTAAMAAADRAGRDDADETDGESASQTAGRRRFDALHGLLTGRLGTPPVQPPPAGPLEAVVDVAELGWFDPTDGHTFGQLLTTLAPGALPLAPRSLARHVEGCGLQVLLREGGRLIGITAPEEGDWIRRLYVTVDVTQLDDDPHTVWAKRIVELCAGSVWLTGDRLDALPGASRVRLLGSDSPTAHLSDALRVFLRVRDGQCRAPACSLPGALCETHHLTKRRHGGKTLDGGLGLFCHVHHHAFDHHGTWTVTMGADGTMTFHHPDLPTPKTTVPRHLRRVEPTRPSPDAGKKRRRRQRTRSPDPPAAKRPPPEVDADLPF